MTFFTIAAHHCTTAVTALQKYVNVIQANIQLRDGFLSLLLSKWPSPIEPMHCSGIQYFRHSNHRRCFTARRPPSCHTRLVSVGQSPPHLFSQERHCLFIATIWQCHIHCHLSVYCTCIKEYTCIIEYTLTLCQRVDHCHVQPTDSNGFSTHTPSIPGQLVGFAFMF